MQNRDVFIKDPTSFTIPNEGVTKVLEPQSAAEWDVLRYELQSFVCEGEYERGLERILDTYLAHLNEKEQPAVWVSGFYGSGKSHFLRVLEYLWRDYEFPDGVTARGLVKLPATIAAQLRELTTQGRRGGGLWSAAGKLSAAADTSVRLALLAILFGSAGLPEQYQEARLFIWLLQNGHFEAVKTAVERRGKELNREVRNMYVSQTLAESLLEAIPGYGSDPADVRRSLRDQFPRQTADISDQELLDTIRDVLELRSASTDQVLPCTVLIFDELQQHIGDDGQRALQVQDVVEACSSRFGSQLLFVASGQQALNATPQLQRLQARFRVRVTLSDRDIEAVVRDVVLRKKPDHEAALRTILDHASGEIDRQLGGTRIVPSQADRDDLVPDYPLLPARRRFWEAVLRSVDMGGTTGQLRTQLLIVHEATKAVADRELGWVVAGDVVYDQLESGMQQSGVLLRDMATLIKRLDDGSVEGKLASRLCAAVFLIGQLPTDGPAATGVLATADTLADLLVEDLTAGSASLRMQIPNLLERLVTAGTLMQVGKEYRLQTREHSEWDRDYRGRFTRIQADDGRIASDRAAELRAALQEVLRGLTLTQGDSKTPRKLDPPHFGVEPPSAASGNVPIWVRDEWSVAESGFRADAQAAGTASPIVYVFLPRRDPDGLRAALAAAAAAQETIDARPVPTTPEGTDARLAMQSRLELERGRVRAIVQSMLAGGRVLLGGGSEIAAGTLRESISDSVDAALVRLFPSFPQGDDPRWGEVVRRVSQGAADALTALGYQGDVDDQPTCKAVRAFIGGSWKKGSAIRAHFTGAGYGWPQDAVDGALLALLAGGFVKAARNGQPVAARGLNQTQIGATDFQSEGVTVSAKQRIEVRGLLQSVGLPIKPGEEAEAIPKLLQRLIELAAQAGGEAPLPEPPSTALVDQLQGLLGNEQFVAVHDRRAELQELYKAWTEASSRAAARQPSWAVLERLLRHANGLPIATTLAAQAAAIRDGRSLLADPDPVRPLHDQLADALRAELRAARERLVAVRDREVADLNAASDWQPVPAEERTRLLAASNLDGVPDLQVADDQALLRTLDTTPLAEWDDKLTALPARAARAREEAAKLLEPKAVRVYPKAATLRTKPDVDDYLAALRSEVMEQVELGNPVII